MHYALAGVIWTTYTLVCHNYLAICFCNANTSTGYYMSRSYKKLKAWTRDTIYNATFYIHSLYNVRLSLHMERHVLFVALQIKHDKSRWHWRSLRNIGGVHVQAIVKMPSWERTRYCCNTEDGRGKEGKYEWFIFITQAHTYIWGNWRAVTLKINIDSWYKCLAWISEKIGHF